MKKVLFITNYPSPYRVDFFNELGKQAEIDLTVVFIEKIAEQTHRDSSWFHENYDYFHPIFLNDRKNIYKGIYICTDIIKHIRLKYDEIIFGGYNYPTMMYAMQYLQMKNIPYSIEIDGAFIKKENHIKRFVKKHFISSASKWYSTGDVSDKYFLEYGAQKDKIYQYPFSSLKESDVDERISENEFNVRKLALRKLLEIKEERVVLSVGQYIKRKGFDILLKATCSLPPDVGVYIIGGKPKQEYIDFINNKKMNNVHFIDFQKKEDLKKYYFASDIFVLPTREDIWGLVINEAMAYGVPVITTDKCIAGLQLINPGKNGYIVPVEDDIALAKSINSILESHALYKMRNQCLNVAHEYTIEKMARKHIEIICEGNR